MNFFCPTRKLMCFNTLSFHWPAPLKQAIQYFPRENVKLSFLFSLPWASEMVLSMGGSSPWFVHWRYLDFDLCECHCQKEVVLWDFFSVRYCATLYYRVVQKGCDNFVLAVSTLLGADQCAMGQTEAGCWTNCSLLTHPRSVYPNSLNSSMTE